MITSTNHRLSGSEIILLTVFMIFSCAKDGEVLGANGGNKIYKKLAEAISNTAVLIQSTKAHYESYRIDPNYRPNTNSLMRLHNIEVSKDINESTEARLIWYRQRIFDFTKISLQMHLREKNLEIENSSNSVAIISDSTRRISKVTDSLYAISTQLKALGATLDKKQSAFHIPDLKKLIKPKFRHSLSSSNSLARKIHRHQITTLNFKLLLSLEKFTTAFHKDVRENLMYR